MSVRSQVIRAPNEKFYVIWRGEPVCGLGGVLYYFETNREAHDFFDQCEKEGRLVDWDLFVT